MTETPTVVITATMFVNRLSFMSFEKSSSYVVKVLRTLVEVNSPLYISTIQLNSVTSNYWPSR
ncbi:hypothetical protein DXC27_20770 [Ruminococcus sp. OM08-7]|nr:hypothetical protein DXC27_20770 [Ruminococcus sp. OM08-7]